MKFLTAPVVCMLLAFVAPATAQTVGLCCPVTTPTSVAAAVPNAGTVATPPYNSYRQPYYVPQAVTVQPSPSCTVVSYPAQDSGCYQPCDTAAPQLGVAAMSAYRPVVTLWRMPRDTYVSRGILGQPTVYVPGQPLRNFLRYISP